MAIRISSDVAGWDPYTIGGLTSIMHNWLEDLFTANWTTSPTTFNFKEMFYPTDYMTGALAQSYEMPNPTTVIVHVRQGVYWQNLPPANGRELTASDVVYNFDRYCGLGDGFTKPMTQLSTVPVFESLTSVAATDNYTVVFDFNQVNLESILEGLLGTSIPIIMCPDAIEAYTSPSNPSITNWHDSIGTGPFIITDFVDGSSATLVKNPNYWGYDERYPQNQLPYANTVDYLIIPNTATAEAALRAGKIDIMDGISNTDAASINSTNPQILQSYYTNYAGITLDPRDVVTPFNNLQVREAMQKAIDLPTIAKTYYDGTVDPNPLTLTSGLLSGWGFPYSQWPQSLVNEYSYDPATAKQLLASAGYPNGFNTTVIAENTADLTLLQIVQSYLAAVNINMSITTLDDASWVNQIQNAHQFTGLAYKQIGQLGDDYSPMAQLGVFQTGGNFNIWGISDPIIDADAVKAQAATSSLSDIKSALSSMNEEIAEQVYSISLLDPVLYALNQPWIHGYTGQYNSISGSQGGGALTGFYLARFWITPQ
jgi:peptide/nickel transport system substrate-binding protein